MNTNLPASRRWSTVGYYPKPRVTDRRAEFALRWRDRKQIKHAEPEPSIRWLAEIAFLAFVIFMLAVVVVAARDAAASRKSQPSTPAVHAR